LKPERMSERILLKIGAICVILGVIVFAVAGSFHGGHEPHNLIVTLPQDVSSGSDPFEKSIPAISE